MRPDIGEDVDANDNDEAEDIANWSEEELPQGQAGRFADQSTEGSEEISEASTSRTRTPEQESILEDIEVSQCDRSSTTLREVVELPHMRGVSDTGKVVGSSTNISICSNSAVRGPRN